MALGQEEIGNRIRRARDDAGMTQPQLAEAIGLRTAQSISRYERAETEVPVKRLRRIAEATGKPFSYFTQDAAMKEPTPETEADLLQQAVVEALEKLDQILELLHARAV